MSRRAVCAQLVRSSGSMMLAIAGVFLLLCGSPAGAATLESYFGVFVGRAEVTDLVSGETETRDLDIVISPYRTKGFLVRWISVTLVDGRRDVPGVTRRVSEEVFLPDESKPFFVEAADRGLFAEREEPVPLGGDPIRWALIDEQGLHTHTFVLLEDGTYELQSYTRRRTAAGLELRYQRIVDGQLRRTIVGHAVKTE